MLNFQKRHFTKLQNRSLGHLESTLKGVACHNKIPDLNFHELLGRLEAPLALDLLGFGF